MIDPLYLDTARLGQISPRAYRASVDFARLGSEHGLSMYFSDFLAGGAAAWPDRLNDRYPGLADWTGVAGLGQRIKLALNAPESSEVFFAARSAVLMQLAARLMILPCRNVLVTDLNWPAYQRIFEKELRGAYCQFTVAHIRDAVFCEKRPADSVIETLASTYVREKCDGVFLPLVDNRGVHLPVSRIVESIRQSAELRFVVVDAAQAIAHVPIDLADQHCDLLIGGCHKWLQAFNPLGIAVTGRSATTDYVRDSLARWLVEESIDDPLLRLTQDLSGCLSKPYGETVQVAPLFTACGGAVDFQSTTTRLESLTTLDQITELARSTGWQAVLPHTELASRIVLLRAQRANHRFVTSETLRRKFLDHGIALTAYDDGVIRISLPCGEMPRADLDRLSSALARVGSELTCG